MIFLSITSAQIDNAPLTKVLPSVKLFSMRLTIDIKFQELLICAHQGAANLPIQNQSPHNAKPHSNKGNPVLICPSIGRCHGSTTPSKGLCPQICSRSMPAFFRPHIPTAYVLLIL